MKRGLMLSMLILPLLASAEIVDLKWAGGSFAHKTGIAPKKFLEVCGKLKSGDKVSWSFNGTAPADFNIHYHVGKDVIYPEQRKDLAGAEGAISVMLEQDYCWMWSNRSAQSIDIEVRLVQTAGGQ